MGQTPNEITGVLSPVIDLSKNYLADVPLQDAQANQITSTITTTIADFTVPTGELWYTFAITTQSISTAGGRDGIAVPVFRSPGGGVQIPLATVYQTPQTLALGESHTVAKIFPEPLLLGPGTVVGSTILHTNGTLSVITTALYRSVQV
jgi:hypothetical protein